MKAYFFIFCTIGLTVYGQMVIKWKMSQASAPDQIMEKIPYILKMMLDPWIISSFAAAFAAALCWMITLTRMDLSYAYPFMSLSFVTILLLSGMVFQEPITMHKIIGILMIVVGVIINSSG